MKSLLPVVVIISCLQCLDCQKEAQETSRLNFFDIDLLRYAAEDRQGNVMVSPASIKSTLAMILEGARGVTEAEIRSALRLFPNKEDFRDQLNVYLRALQSNSSGVVLENANSVFVSNKLKLRSNYKAIIQNLYLSEVNKISFDDPLIAADIINHWVGNKTKGLIPFIVDPLNLDSSSQILLTNALYFKAAWQHSFNPRLTQPMCFYDHGACKTVAMMDLHAELNYAYVDNLRAHAVELPYVGRRYSMILLVPHDRDGCVSLLRDLPYMSLPTISKLMEPTDVQLSLPRFTIDYSEDMVDALRSMRVKSLFSSTSNLSGIFEEGSPLINKIFHKVHMTVDEVGTVAAAATAAMVIPLISSGGVQLRVDRPFVFFIRDNQLGLVLFEGKIDEPTAHAVTKVPVVDKKESSIQNITANHTEVHIQKIPVVEVQPIVKSKKRFGFFGF